MIDDGASMTLLIAELEAWLPQGAGAERYVRPLAEALLSARRAAAEQGGTLRILPDHRLTGEPGADFLLQIDDYDVRLKLLADDAEASAVLAEASALLADNPGTVALVWVWWAADPLRAAQALAAAPLTAAQARAATADPLRAAQALAALRAAARPLPDVLRTLIGAQVAVWDVPPDEPDPVRQATGPGADLAGRTVDIHQVFQSAVAQAFDAERLRSYRTEARKEAARAFSVEDETAVILDALDRALAGAPAAALTPLLTRTASRRGAR